VREMEKGNGAKAKFEVGSCIMMHTHSQLRLNVGDGLVS
jgi:hypothetical protein